MVIILNYFFPRYGILGTTINYNWEEIDLKKQSKLLALIYSVFIVVPVYGILIFAYYFDLINGFVFLGSLIVALGIAIVLLIIFRKDKFKSLTIILVSLLFSLLWGFEMRLLSYESNTYMADGFREPEELLDDSGIHILSVALFDIHYFEDEEKIKEFYNRDDVQLFNLYKVKNRDRYMSKTTEFKQFFGFAKEDFQVMQENVNNFVGEDIPVINEFLSRDNLSGDSAGLALAITAFIYQGSLENNLPIGMTGTLEPNGDTIEVGGIKEKIMISEQSNLPYIIIPLANLKEAETIKSQQKLNIKIIPVSHFDEAILAIEELNEKQ